MREILPQIPRRRTTLNPQEKTMKMRLLGALA
jgi:hypothetical protein